MRSVSAYTQAPVSVAKSIMNLGRVRLASASVSARTIRPSASVWITWIVTPLLARTISCGRYALGPISFSVIASQASAVIGARSSASATSVASATALPAMSVCMSSIDLCVFRLMPPVSNRMPLPTNATSGACEDLRRAGR